MAWYDLDTNEIVDNADVGSYVKDTGNAEKCINEMCRDHDLARQWGLGYATIRCNWCGRYFEDDNDLMEVEDRNGWTQACPDCMTDEYLMDLD